MAEMVASALVQEGVSGVLSMVASNREEKASQGRLMERLEMAQSGLKFALERSSKMPITDVSLLQRRVMLNGALEECTVVCNRLLLEVGDEEAEQRTVPVSSSLLSRMFRHAVQLVNPKEDLLNRSEVERFECFAEKAHMFVREVESGVSLLARNRFSNPIVTQLLEGKKLGYVSWQGNNHTSLLMHAIVTENQGVMAGLKYIYSDLKAPTNGFSLHLELRLSESTNIVGISTKCLQSLAPDFKCFSEVATGLLVDVYPQVQVSNHNYSLSDNGFHRPDPVCCTTSGLNKCCTSSTTSSELSGRFPEQVSCLYFSCKVSERDYHSTKVWPYLILSAMFAPHFPCKDWQVSTLPLHDIEETVLTEAILCFSCQREQTEYEVEWRSQHGGAKFTVWKTKDSYEMSTQKSRTISDGSKMKR